MLERHLFSPRHNPFHQHADVQLFLARRGDAVVGRVSAHIDHEYNRYHSERVGSFGFFECDDDPEAATALLHTAGRWLRERGMEIARGPLSFSTNSEVGFLVEGFDSPPVALMPYSKTYYLSLLEQAGYSKAQDLYAWKWRGHYMPENPARMVAQLREKPEIRIRRPSLRRFDEEVRTILDVNNEAWSENWGFVPATSAEAQQLAADLKLIVDPEIIPIVEIDGVTAGVALAIPNLNEAIHDLGGRLFPLGLLKLLWRTKVRRVKSGRLVLMGIRKEFRTRNYAALAYLLCDEIYRSANKQGYQWAEFSWTLEQNSLINSLIMKIGCERYKTYRIYEKALTP